MTLQFNQAIAEPSNFCILYTANSKHNLVRMANTVKPLFTGNDTLTLLLMALVNEHIMPTFCTRHNVCTQKNTSIRICCRGVHITVALLHVLALFPSLPHRTIACERGSGFTNLTKTKRL